MRHRKYYITPNLFTKTDTQFITLILHFTFFTSISIINPVTASVLLFLSGPPSSFVEHEKRTLQNDKTFFTENCSDRQTQPFISDEQYKLFLPYMDDVPYL